MSKREATWKDHLRNRGIGALHFGTSTLHFGYAQCGATLSAAPSSVQIMVYFLPTRLWRGKLPIAYFLLFFAYPAEICSCLAFHGVNCLLPTAYSLPPKVFSLNRRNFLTVFIDSRQSGKSILLQPIFTNQNVLR